MRSLTLALATLAAIGSLATAQHSTTVHESRPVTSVVQVPLGYRDPGTATIIGALVAGGGQMYAGKSGKGLALLGLAAGAVVMGAALVKPSECRSYPMPPHVGGPPGEAFTTCTDARRGSLYAGLGVAAAAWVYGVISAGTDARDTNAALLARGALAPLFDVDAAHARVALALHF